MPLTDAPAPIPAEGVWSGDPADIPNWDAMPRRNRRRRRRSAYPAWLKYVGACVGLAAILSMVQIAVHAVRSDPRDAAVYADRELRLTLLKPNERVVATVSVWQRPPIDYFRATRGMLVLTSAPGDSARPVGGRIIYLGLQPRDPLSPPDAPPTFDEREWPVDTSVVIAPSRTFFMLARALSISAPREPRLTVGVPAPASRRGDEFLAALEQRHQRLRTIGWGRREVRRARAREAAVAEYMGRREWFHTVRRGEAISSIAHTFNTTPEEIRRLNGLSGDRIRLGQTLRVKGWTKTAVPFPASGVMPDFQSPASAPTAR